MVLLIDQDADFRAALAAHLLDDGYRVAEFTTPSEVPRQRLQSVTLLVLEYQMGEESLAFAERVNAMHPEVPVVMIAAYIGARLESEVAARPFMRLRRKPVDYDELARLIPPARG